VQISIVPSSSKDAREGTQGVENVADSQLTTRLEKLQASIDTLSVTLATRPALLQSKALIGLLDTTFNQGDESKEASSAPRVASASDAIVRELEWVLVGKATAQTQALLLDALIIETVPLYNEIHYWRGVLSTYPNTALYSLQTSPIRLWKWSKSVLREARQREVNVAEGWRKFYGLVRTVIREQSATDVRARIVSPLVLIRGEIQVKQGLLERARLLNAGGIGYLLSNGINSER